MRSWRFASVACWLLLVLVLVVGACGYDPCGDRQCGDTCTICEQGDTDCSETAVTKTCNADLVCVSAAGNVCR